MLVQVLTSPDQWGYAWCLECTEGGGACSMRAILSAQNATHVHDDELQERLQYHDLLSGDAPQEDAHCTMIVGEGGFWIFPERMTFNYSISMHHQSLLFDRKRCTSSHVRQASSDTCCLASVSPAEVWSLVQYYIASLYLPALLVLTTRHHYARRP